MNRLNDLVGMVIDLHPSTSHKILDTKTHFLAMVDQSITEFWFSPGSNKLPSNMASTPSQIMSPEQASYQTPVKKPMPPSNDTSILVWYNSMHKAKQIEQNLHIAGFMSTHCASSYQDGLTYLKENEIEVFLIDTELDKIGGYELVKALRNSNTFRHAPILMLSKTHQIDDVLQAMKAGANDLVAGPLTPEVLNQKISLYMKVSDA